MTHKVPLYDEGRCIGRVSYTENLDHWDGHNYTCGKFRNSTRKGTAMGLDTTHGCWHGAYSRFGEWREAVARAAGIADWAKKNPDPTNEELYGRWKATPSDPLMVLWSHSDCDGVIQAAQCIPLAEALLKLACDMRGHERENTLRFASGLLLAASRDEDVEFH